MNKNVQESKQAQKTQSLPMKVARLPFVVVAVLVLSLTLSIVIEWVGMSLIWESEGVEHSERMLKTELGYLKEFDHYLLGIQPNQIAIFMALSIRYWLFEYTHFNDLIRWSQQPSNDTGFGVTDGVINRVKKLNLWIFPYIYAAFNIVQLFGVRLTTAMLTFPTFCLFGLVAVLRGLGERELRRYGGDYETSFVYHHAKPWRKYSFVGACLLYLSIPVATHPNAVFIPATILFSTALYVTTWKFKKYL